VKCETGQQRARGLLLIIVLPACNAGLDARRHVDGGSKKASAQIFDISLRNVGPALQTVREPYRFAPQRISPLDLDEELKIP